MPLLNPPGSFATRRPTATEWMGLSFLGGLILVFVAEVTARPGDLLGVALRWTARWSFVWFWLASCSSALALLFGLRFRALAVRAREFGLAFASAHLVHVALVAYMLHGAATPFDRRTLVFFGVGVCFTYLLALITLSGRLREWLGPTAWRAVRSVGIEYITLAYFSDFIARTFHKGAVNFLVYAPFLALTVAGPLLRFSAMIHRRRSPSVGGATPTHQLV